MSIRWFGCCVVLNYYPRHKEKWSSVFKQFDRWCSHLVWKDLHSNCIRYSDIKSVFSDGTVIRAHAYVAGRAGWKPIFPSRFTILKKKCVVKKNHDSHRLLLAYCDYLGCLNDENNQAADFYRCAMVIFEARVLNGSLVFVCYYKNMVLC